MEQADRIVRLPQPVDLIRTLRPLQQGPLDPTMIIDNSGVWRATRTPEGIATIHFATTSDGVAVRAWGPGARWAAERAAGMVGSHDSPESFHPDHVGLRRLHRRFPGLRIGRSEAVFEHLVPAILGQRVTFGEAARSWRRLVEAFSEPAPGPRHLLLPPAPEALGGLGYYDLHPFGVEKTRAMTILRACATAARLQRNSSLGATDTFGLLTKLPGIGPWTAAKTATVALGDADAVPVGDFHLPNQVCWALAAEPRGNDDRMLELLEPYRGHRGRVLKLLHIAGPRPERRGPRYNPLPIARL